ncbi:MAG: dUTP diphosphatase [Candidatus Nomurabacteria bacterium]|nr:dUTP diphosphatase [Candidatus Nomurabacteria bacterium]
MELKVKKLREDAKLPTYGHQGDAGMDFYAKEDVVLFPGKQARIHTGVAVEIPDGYVGLIWDKSSISFNMGLKVMGGVIDSGYRGEIIMNLLNTGDKEVTMEKGHKVAQMIIQKFEHCDIVEVDGISDTERGEGREGSTGYN